MHDIDASVLPIGTYVDAYEIVGHLGRGGFGITYKVFDPGLNSYFALKEFFPTDLVARDGKVLKLLAKSRAEADYQWARRKFVDEAQLLAQLSHPNIVNVRRILEDNNTVYMLLDFIPGSTLEDWLQSIDGPPTQEEMDRIGAPLLDALELVHENGTCHLDIAPDNILIRSTDGAPILLDFGAARLEIKQHSQLVSAMLFKSGYSAPEQYTSSAYRYGPWTDIYATGATFYRAIAGQRPIESTERSLRDQLVPATQIGKGRYRQSFLRAIDSALRLPLDERPQSVAAWRAGLLGAKASSDGSSLVSALVARVTALAASVKARALQSWQGLSPRQRMIGMGAGAMLAMLFVVVGVVASRPGSGPAPGTPEAGIASGRTPQPGAPASVSLPVARPAPSIRPGRIVTLPVKLGALVAEPSKAWLGAKVAPVNQSMAKSFGLLSTNGAFLQDAGSESAVWQAGGRAGDIILGVNGREIANPADLRSRIQGAVPGEQVTLEVWRFGTDTQSFKDVLLELVALGDGHAMNWLGVYSFGSTVLPRDDKLALDWLTKGAEAGDVDAMFNLGNMLAEGTRTRKDLTKAVSRLADAALRGHQPAAARLSDAHAELNNTFENAARQAAVIRKLADLGNVAAMRVLGRWYAAGYGVPKDKPEGLRWYLRAGELGDADAYSDAAWMHLQGDGVPEDNARAAHYFRMGIAMGAIEGMRHLSWQLDNGIGVERRDPELAAELTIQAFASGDNGSLKFVSTDRSKSSLEHRIAVQRRLKDAGFYSGAVDGRLNEATIAALKALHKAQPRVIANM